MNGNIRGHSSEIPSGRILGVFFFKNPKKMELRRRYFQPWIVNHQQRPWGESQEGEYRNIRTIFIHIWKQTLQLSKLSWGKFEVKYLN